MIFKLSLAIVVVDAGGLVDEVCLDQIDVAVEVKVSDADSHASQSSPELPSAMPRSKASSRNVPS